VIIFLVITVSRRYLFPLGLKTTERSSYSIFVGDFIIKFREQPTKMIVIVSELPTVQFQYVETESVNHVLILFRQFLYRNIASQKVLINPNSSP